MVLLLAAVIIIIVISLCAVKYQNKSSSLAAAVVSSSKQNGVDSTRSKFEQSKIPIGVENEAVGNGNGHATPPQLMSNSIRSSDFANNFQLFTKSFFNTENENKSESINSNSGDDIISISHYPSFSERKKTSDIDTIPHEC